MVSWAFVPAAGGSVSTDHGVVRIRQRAAVRNAGTMVPVDCVAQEGYVAAVTRAEAPAGALRNGDSRSAVQVGYGPDGPR